MFIVFLCLITVIVILSLRIGVLVEIDNNNNVTKMFYVTIAKRIKVFSKEIRFTKINKKENKKVRNRDDLLLIKQIVKNIDIREIKLKLELANENVILNTYLVAIISAIMESLREIKKIDNMYYKIENSDRYKILLKLKLEANAIKTYIKYKFPKLGKNIY